MIGIYKITSPKNVIYIGQSRNIKKRFGQHRGYPSKKKNSWNLYRSFFEFGVSNHIFEVIHQFEYEVTQDVLDEYEDLYIRHYRHMGFELFNVKGGGIKGKLTEEFKKHLAEIFPDELKKRYSQERSGEKNKFFGKNHSDETRKKMALASKTNKLGSKNGRARVILQYDLDFNLIREWDTVTNASIALGINRLAISSALARVETGKSNGFIWKYKFPKVKEAS